MWRWTCSRDDRELMSAAKEQFTSKWGIMLTAIGMAEHGHDYRAILRHYFNGAQVAPIY